MTATTKRNSIPSGVATVGEVAAPQRKSEGVVMDPNEKCVCTGNHERHICFLHSKGFIDEVEKLTANPTVTCSICLVNANSPDNVCSPTTLGGGFKYSDMQYSKKIICDSVADATPEEKGAEEKGTEEKGTEEK
jgi:hypothetical protein